MKLQRIGEMTNESYQSGKIYKITPLNQEFPFYIGSTRSKYLSTRLRQHKNNFLGFMKGSRNYCSSYQILEMGESQITLIENFPTHSKDELVARERYWIERLDECVNKRRRPWVSDEERRQTKNEQKKRYRENHRAELCQKQLEYYCKHRDELCAKGREKVACSECGTITNRSGSCKHKKTKRCLSSRGSEKGVDSESDLNFLDN